MNEIKVVVNQEPGSITWNFEDIKSALVVALAEYQGMVYDDETIKSAKTDVAELRKLAKVIEERRKEVKEKCLEPYSIIEAQAKELVSLIDKPIQAINVQVQDYENRRKEKVKAEINAYWEQKADAIPECIRTKAYESIYDSRWENATATKKSWKDGIDNGITHIVGDIDTIKSFASKFEEDMLQVFYKTLSLQDAIRKMNDMNAQEQKILERQKREQEEREARERALAEAELAKAQSVSAPEETPEVRQNVMPENTAVSASDIPPATAQQEMRQTVVHDPVMPNTEGSQEVETITLKITTTPEKIAKIKAFLKFTEASFEEV